MSQTGKGILDADHDCNPSARTVGQCVQKNKRTTIVCTNTTCKKYIYIKIIIIKKMGGKWKERKKEKSLHRVPEVISALINHAHFPLIWTLSVRSLVAVRVDLQGMQQATMTSHQWRRMRQLGGRLFSNCTILLSVRLCTYIRTWMQQNPSRNYDAVMHHHRLHDEKKCEGPKRTAIR